MPISLSNCLFNFGKTQNTMKQTLLLLVAIVTFSCTNAQKSEFTPEALSEKLLAPNNEQVSFQDIIEKHKGKTVVIEVWASWCGDCIKAMPKFKELQANHPEVDYIFLSVDKAADKWKTGIEKHQLVGDHYMVNDGMKGTFGKAIDLDWIPRYIVLDKTGKIVTYRAIETDFAQITETLNGLN